MEGKITTPAQPTPQNVGASKTQTPLGMEAEAKFLRLPPSSSDVDSSVQGDPYTMLGGAEVGTTSFSTEDPSGDESANSLNSDRKTVAIFADYDGCFDIVSPSNLAGAKMDKMFDYAAQIGTLLHRRDYAEKMLTDFLKEITANADEVILFSASNRQSRKVDEFSAAQNDNGSAMTGLKDLAKAKGWQFNPSLLEDAGTPVDEFLPPGFGRFSSFDDFRDPDLVQSGSGKIKQMLAENNFACLPGPAEVYFFADVEKYLTYTRNMAHIPENIELKTVLFDWYGICIEGTQTAPLLPIEVERPVKGQ
mmetsp:Transcript_126012/g.218515  ORF Transcript_126012/g.218515 Transcript_126012/m.218515 type:complete len:306 (-) Transcript_126012:16-933(-)